MRLKCYHTSILVGVLDTQFPGWVLVDEVDFTKVCLENDLLMIY